jgi:hypothetical protein
MFGLLRCCAEDNKDVFAIPSDTPPIHLPCARRPGLLLTQVIPHEYESVIVDIEYPEEAGLAEEMQFPGQAEAISVMQQVQKLASSTRRRAWTRFRSEQEVVQVQQKLPQDSLSESCSLSLQESEEERIKDELEALFSSGRGSAEEASAAIELLEAAICRKETFEFKDRALWVCGKQCLDMFNLALKREELARMLEKKTRTPPNQTDHTEGSVSHFDDTQALAFAASIADAAKQKKDLELLVLECQLEERLEYCARRVLDLSVSVGSVTLLKRLSSRVTETDFPSNDPYRDELDDDDDDEDEESES